MCRNLRRTRSMAIPMPLTTDQKMRIVFLLPPLGMSGGIKVVAIYAQALHQRGHHVILISPPHPAESFFKRLKNLARGKGWQKASHTRPSPLDGSGLEHHLLEKYRSVIETDVPDADVIIASWWETAEWVNALPERCGAKVYFIQHHEVFPYLPVERCHATYRFPMHQIVIAKWLEDTMRNLYSSKALDLVENSVDRHQFHAPPRQKSVPPTIGFLYATAGFKGMDVTIAAINRLRASIPDLRVISFGSETEATNLPLPPETEFTHYPAQSEIHHLYAKCDVWMTASRTEGFNLPALEAMACRTPVVSTKAGWAAEAVINGFNGALVDVDDVDALVKSAHTILTMDNATWTEMSRHAFETASKGSWEESAAKFESILVNLCATRQKTKKQVA